LLAVGLNILFGDESGILLGEKTGACFGSAVAGRGFRHDFDYVSRHGDLNRIVRRRVVQILPQTKCENVNAVLGQVRKDWAAPTQRRSLSMASATVRVLSPQSGSIQMRSLGRMVRARSMRWRT